MNKFCAIALLLVVFEPASAHQQQFENRFSEQTMRVDIFHTGGKGTEIIALDRVVNDGPWPGSRTQLLDTTNLGKYRFEVVDPKTHQVIYSRGFSTIYGEWETTGEAKTTYQTFHESLRFPWPLAPVQILLKKRGPTGFTDLWSQTIDPDSRFVNPERFEFNGTIFEIIKNGSATEKVDLLLIGDGYTETEAKKFRKDATRLVNALFKTEPFSSRKKDFNVNALLAPSSKSGVSRPRAGQFRRSTTGVQYNIFDSERYVLTYDNRALRDLASAVPYDFIEILVNESQYGGGGIYNFQATTSVDTAFAEYVFIHEFGHHFASLADEYYTSPVSYETGAPVLAEPWEPNVTALKDPDNLKWKKWLSPTTPLPTPWPKEQFEKLSRGYQKQRAELRAAGAPESELDALFTRQKIELEKLLGAPAYATTVGAFEGASYEPAGLYRPQMDCIMFTRNDVGFCTVCHEAISTIIDMYSR